MTEPDNLIDRLRGRYAIGPILPNGEPEFGWRQTPTISVTLEAADEIERLNARIAELEQMESEGVKPVDPDEIRREEQMRCAKIVCTLCRQGKPLNENGIHSNGRPCEAYQINILMQRFDQADDQPDTVRVTRHSHGPLCYDCGMVYGGSSWMDAVVSNDDWARISPTGDEGGLLCVSCMAKRFNDAGHSEIPMQITSGPFVGKASEAICRDKIVEDTLAKVCRFIRDDASEFATAAAEVRSNDMPNESVALDKVARCENQLADAIEDGVIDGIKRIDPDKIRRAALEEAIGSAKNSRPHRPAR